MTRLRIHTGYLGISEVSYEVPSPYNIKGNKIYFQNCHAMIFHKHCTLITIRISSIHQSNRRGVNYDKSIITFLTAFLMGEGVSSIFSIILTVISAHPYFAVNEG